MKPDHGMCDTCNKGKFELKEKKSVGGSPYNILKCNACHHEVARRVE